MARPPPIKVYKDKVEMEAKQSNKSPFLPLISQFSIIHKSSVKQTVIVGTFEQLCVEQKKS